METSTVTGDRLRALRERCGLSQADLGALLGFTKQAICLWELGRRRPRPATLAALLAALRSLGVQDES